MINETIIKFIILAPSILIALVVHETAHGWIAYKLGDPTAKNAGRLTLNPLKHLDFWGTLVFVITQMVGWAKPVPVNPNFFRKPRQDMVWVALAGPLSNILLAAGFAACYHILTRFMSVTQTVGYEFPLMLLVVFFVINVQINIGLAIFNLIPIPPLDGSKVMMGILPVRQAILYSKIERYGFIILIVLIFTHSFDHFLFPLIHGLKTLLLGGG